MKIKILFFFMVSILFESSVFAQENQSASWIRLQSDNGEFSIEMPANHSYFFDPDGFSYEEFSGKTYQFAQMQLVNGAIEKTVMTLEIYKVYSPKSHLDQLVEKQKFNASKRDESQPGFTIRTFEQKKFKDSSDGKNIEISHITKFIASKTHLYVVTVANRGAKTSSFDRFLLSMRLNHSTPNQSDNSDARFVRISSLKPITINEVFEDASGAAKPDSSAKTKVTEITSAKNIASVLILTKPLAGYTEAARKGMITGKIRFRVTFAKDGRIPKIGIITGLPGGLNRNAFFCVLRIKFLPNEKDGIPETVNKQIEYTFSIY